MNIPGSNLLNLALGVIAPQGLAHNAWVSRSTNAAGDDVDVYADAVPILGSMQPIDRRLYQQLGLSLAKNYSKLYTSVDVRVTETDRAGDRLTYGGKVWQAESDLNWGVADGWRAVLCVEVTSP